VTAEKHRLLQVVEQGSDRGGITGQRRPVVRISVDAWKVDRADGEAPPVKQRNDLCPAPAPVPAAVDEHDCGLFNAHRCSEASEDANSIR
jgi:hypothetical protein